MNSGKAVSVQLDDDVQMVVIMASPGGREENNDRPTQATPISDKPTQTPEPSRTKRVMIKMPNRTNSFKALFAVLVFHFRLAVQTQMYQVIGHSYGKQYRAGAHRQLWYPDRRRVLSLRDVVNHA